LKEIPLDSSVSEGRKTTMREWKRRQMGLVGSAVPIVRCHLHGRTLNLSFGGEIYESELEWEKNFARWVHDEDLRYPERLFKGTMEVLLIAPRESQCTLAQIDLSNHYNGSVLKEWYPERARGSALASIRMGLQELAGVRFDVRGVIQLSARDSFRLFPDATRGIKVDQKCQGIHFLHGTRRTEKLAAPVCRFVIHFADGETDECQVLYGTHVLDWWAEPGSLKAQVAWTGSSEGRQSVRLYKTHWENPRPGTVVTSVDFISSASTSAPFLVAITAEP
jgi:hypothetical protein